MGFLHQNIIKIKVYKSNGRDILILEYSISNRIGYKKNTFKEMFASRICIKVSNTSFFFNRNSDKNINNFRIRSCNIQQVALCTVNISQKNKPDDKIKSLHEVKIVTSTTKENLGKPNLLFFQEKMIYTFQKDFLSYLSTK